MAMSRSDENPSGIFDTIKFMMTLFSVLFAAVFATLAFFGWRTISDLGTTIERTVDLRVGELLSDEAEGLRGLNKVTSELVDDHKSARTQINKLLGDLNQASDDLNIIVSGQTDAIGDFIRLSNEISTDETLLYDVEARKRAEITFSKLIEMMTRSTADATEFPDGRPRIHYATPETLFNAAALASKFQMPMAAAELATLAWQGSDLPEYLARMNRMLISAGRTERAKAFEDTFALVERLQPDNSMHLTLSEAWNIAVEGRLADLIDALEQLRDRLKDVAPSYIWALQAEALLFMGAEQYVSEALKLITEGIERLERESPRAPWFDSSVESFNQSILLLAAHPIYGETAKELREKKSIILEMPILVALENMQYSGKQLSRLESGAQDPLNSTQNVPSPPGDLEIELGLPMTISIERGIASFVFVPEASGVYEITARAMDELTDPLVMLTDDMDQVIAWDDDSGGSFDALLEQELTEGNTYRIAVGSAKGEGGSIKGIIVVVMDSNL